MERILQELGRAPVFIHSGIGYLDPVVTFCCPTFGTAALRPDLLNEVVYWYLRQTYPHRELLILNDAPGQKLWCTNLLVASGVRIINYPMRIATLGEKRNLMTMLAAGAIILPQDDDDISLPKRAEQAVKMLVSSDYWTPGRWWFYEHRFDTMVPDCNGYGHNCCAFRRAALYNRYEATSGDEDAKVHAWALNNLRVEDFAITDPKELTYIYRWGITDRHISGFATGVNQMQVAYDSFDPGPDGEYEVKAEAGADWISRIAGIE